MSWFCDVAALVKQLHSVLMHTRLVTVLLVVECSSAHMPDPLVPLCLRLVACPCAQAERRLQSARREEWRQQTMQKYRQLW